MSQRWRTWRVPLLNRTISNIFLDSLKWNGNEWGGFNRYHIHLNFSFEPRRETRREKEREIISFRTKLQVGESLFLSLIQRQTEMRDGGEKVEHRWFSPPLKTPTRTFFFHHPSLGVCSTRMCSNAHTLCDAHLYTRIPIRGILKMCACHFVESSTDEEMTLVKKNSVYTS